MTYAWKITKDHIAEGDDHPAVDITGPYRATEDDLARLDDPSQRHKFRLYDDDGMLHFEGFGVGTEDEEGCYGPLGDFGTPYSGCTYIRWDGHPEWDCG